MTLLIYARSLGNDFVFWDDPELVIENPIVHGLTLPHIRSAFTTYDPDLYVPLTMLSFQMNYAVAELHPFLYHFTNILLHAASAVLVGGVALLLLRKKSVALAAALLFAVHPINAEAVAWVSARKDVLSSFFFLCSLVGFLWYRSNERVQWYAISLLGFLLALLSKVSVLGLPFILLLCDWYRGRPLSRRRLMEIAPFFVLSIVFGIVSLFGKMGGSQPLTAKMLVGFKATIFSLFHLVWPVGYSVVYPFTGSADILRPDLLLSLLAVIAAGIGAWIFRKRFPAALFCYGWFLVLIAPSFLTAEKGKDIVTTLYLTSDRYVYLAAIGVFFGTALGLESIRERSRRVFVGVLTVLVIVLGNIAAQQSFTWKNTETLLRHALAWYPGTAIAHNNLGAYYDSIGDAERAAGEYLEAVKSGGTSDAWFNVGIAALRDKRVPEAIVAFTRAVEMRPAFALAQLNLGALLIDSGRIEEAVEHLLVAQKLEPKNVGVYLNLGIALEKGGNTVDALRAYEWALALEPEHAFAKGRVQALRAP